NITRDKAAVGLSWKRIACYPKKLCNKKFANELNRVLNMSKTVITQKKRVSKAAKFWSSKTFNESTGQVRVAKSTSSSGDSKVLDKSSGQLLKQSPRVIDETGQDVTPRTLFNSDPGTLQSKQGKLFPTNDISWTTTTDLPSVAFQTTNTSVNGPFTRSFFGSVSASRTSHTAESLSDDNKDLSSSFSDFQSVREELKEQFREKIPEHLESCYLTETETLWLLDIPSVSVSVDSEDAEPVKERNNAYTELCKHKLGNDMYVERSMQTFGGALKTKEVQCEGIAMVDKAVMSTTWDMYDSFCNINDIDGKPAVVKNEAIVSEPSTTQYTNPSSDQSMSLVTATSSVSGSSSSLEKPACLLPLEEMPDLQLIFQSDKLKQDLALMERVLATSIFQPKLAAYRQLPKIDDPECVWMAKEEESWAEQHKSSTRPFLEQLWVYKCELTVGQNVSCMTWNKKNKDLLAVGYGPFDFKNHKSGLVCCWSLKNPTWPDRIFRCPSGVTALDFSARYANQLAVGMHDGTIAIYNVHTAEQTPITDSSECPNMHTGPVWQLRWIDHENGMVGEDKGEVLISVSSDGRISKWIHYKTLECVDLMKLKIQNVKQNHHISALCAGLCFDFHPNDSKIYLVGTEEDWTIQLWRQDLQNPVLAFTSGHRVVFDIKWSPHCAAVFGALSAGKVEIWDLRVSRQVQVLDPALVYPLSPGVNPRTLLFTPETDCLLVGDTEGLVTVYKLKNILPGVGTQ
ncbi:hypothetical protein DNTS_001597, partial [Danionella cerebrum]